MTPLRSIDGILVKDESFNEFGTHKDRRSRAIIDNCKEGDRVSIISAGNGAMSLALLGRGKISVNAILDHTVPLQIQQALRKAGANVLNYDLSRKLSSEDIERYTGGRDVTNGQEDAYKPILHEILAEANPQVVVVPIGSGELMMGLLNAKIDINSPVEIVGVGVESKTSPADKLYASWTPNRKKIREITRHKNSLFFLSDEEVRYEMEHAPKGLDAEPSALVVFSAVRQLRSQYDRIAVVNTGKGKILS